MKRRSFLTAALASLTPENLAKAVPAIAKAVEGYGK